MLLKKRDEINKRFDLIINKKKGFKKNKPNYKIIPESNKWKSGNACGVN